MLVLKKQWDEATEYLKHNSRVEKIREKIIKYAYLDETQTVKRFLNKLDEEYLNYYQNYLKHTLPISEVEETKHRYLRDFFHWAFRADTHQDRISKGKWFQDVEQYKTNTKEGKICDYCKTNRTTNKGTPYMADTARMCDKCWEHAATPNPNKTTQKEEEE